MYIYIMYVYIDKKVKYLNYKVAFYFMDNKFSLPVKNPKLNCVYNFGMWHTYQINRHIQYEKYFVTFLNSRKYVLANYPTTVLSSEN